MSSPNEERVLKTYLIPHRRLLQTLERSCGLACGSCQPGSNTRGLDRREWETRKEDSLREKSMVNESVFFDLPGVDCQYDEEDTA